MTTTEETLDTFCHMVIEEYLMQKNMRGTLETFRNEWDRPSEDKTMLSWYEVALRLRLPDIISKASEEKSVLENLVNTLVQESSLRTRRQPEVTLNGLASLSKSVSLPAVTSPSCFDFQTNAANGAFASLQNTTEAVKAAAAKARSDDPPKQVRPLSAKTREKARKAKSKISDETQAVIQKQLALMSNEKFGKLKPSSENWVPELTRFRFIHRDIATIQESINSLGVVQSQLDKEDKRQLFLSSHTQRAKVEESLTMTKKMACACCQFKFLYVNLPLKVSQKAILDIRVKWSGGLNSSSVFGKVPRVVHPIPHNRSLDSSVVDSTWEPTFISASDQT